jgi:hypothetical protein
VIHEWSDVTPEFHNILALQYMDRVTRLLEDYHKTLQPGKLCYWGNYDDAVVVGSITHYQLHIDNKFHHELI